MGQPSPKANYRLPVSRQLQADKPTDYPTIAVTILAGKSADFLQIKSLHLQTK